MSEPCAADGCDSVVRARGWCTKHYQRLMKRGTIRRITPEDRFWANVTVTDGCWIWAKTDSGRSLQYGSLRVNGHKVLAHRFAYDLLVGPIPDGLTIDHLCRNTACVNPQHLEPVTLAENISRAPQREVIPAEYCKDGHVRRGIDKQGKIYCEDCRRRYAREYQRRRRAAQSASRTAAA